MDTPSDYKRLIEDGQKYLETKFTLLRLDLLEKLSQIVGIIIMAVVIALLVMAALAFFGAAMVGALCQFMPLWLACVIIGSLFLLFVVLCIVCRTKWFINPMIGVLSAIIFPVNEEEEANIERKEAGDE